jgi:hypothetical protein
MVTAASLADWVTSAFTASVVLIVAPGFRPNLVGAWLAACGVTTSSDVGVTFAGAQIAETARKASSSW